jgi:hypothetical protein
LRLVSVQHNDHVDLVGRVSGIEHCALVAGSKRLGHAILIVSVHKHARGDRFHLG